LGDIGTKFRFLLCISNMMTFASHLATIKTTRCGVIPYTIANGSLYFLLTRDRITSELGDFGGGVRKSEFALMAALREFYEESHGIFSHIYNSANDMGNKIAIIDGSNMAIIFVPLESNWLEEAQRAFVENPPTKKKSDEVSELVWVNEYTFTNLINGRKISNDVLWVKIQSFLKKSYQPKKTQVQDALRAVAVGVKA